MMEHPCPLHTFMLSRLTEALDGSSKYVLDCPFTARFVAEEKRWAFEEGIINWDDVLKR